MIIEDFLTIFIRPPYQVAHVLLSTKKFVHLPCCYWLYEIKLNWLGWPVTVLPYQIVWKLDTWFENWNGNIHSI